MDIMNTRFMFLFKFFQSPTEIGSITPSSSFLAKKMFANINWQRADSIVELGAGTGVFTDFLHKHKGSSTKAIIIEKDHQMREALMERYPSFYFGCEATRLNKILEELQIEKADYILSGLPFANFSPEMRNELIQAVYQSLKPNGLFVAFQYSLQMKDLLKTHFKKVEIDFVPLNLPPAFVYTCRKS